MRTIVTTTLLAMATLAHGAAIGGHLDKMSPLVRRAAIEGRTAQHMAQGARARGICAFVAISPDSIEAVLTANGCRVHDSRGGICIVTAPTHRLSRIAASPAVRRIEAARPANLHMDTTATVVNAMPIYQGTLLPQAYDGAGVTVGVMDVGFDLTHPNFYDRPMTLYRIAAMWDMLSTDTVGSTLPVGRDYTGSDALLTHQRSTDGHLQTHGTHTLGIAAGSGYDSPYQGMAPASDICVVSNAVSDDLQLIAPEDIYKYTSATDALGFKYLFDNAALRGQPCVASFSEGYVPIYDSEDSLYNAYLAQLTGPGRIIVSSAGNECVRLNYMAKPRGVAEVGSFLLCYGEEAGFFVQTDAPAQVLLLSYGGTTTDTLHIDLGRCPADSAYTIDTTIGAEPMACRITVERWPSAFGPADTLYHIGMEADASLHRASPLAVVLRGADAEASLRAYAPAMWVNGLADERWADAQMSHNVSAPAYFESVIAVGSTIHRTGFTNYLGTYYDYSQQGRNDGVRAEYSSVGPTMDGRTKPDVMAPGNNIVSSYSSYYEEHNPTAGDLQSDVARFTLNGRTYAWNSNTGTSMAAPVVAGIIALWLQAKPDLTPQEALEAMAATCRHPEDGMAYPNNEYGHGEIDAYRGLLHLLGIDGIEAISQHQPQSTVIRPLGGSRLHIAFATAPTLPVALSIYSTAGTKLHSATIAAGSLHSDNSTTIALPPLPSGVYAVQVDSREHGIGGSTLVRL